MMEYLGADLAGSLIEKGFAMGSSILLAVLILIVGWIVSKWAASAVVKAGDRSKLDTALTRFLSGMAQYRRNNRGQHPPPAAFCLRTAYRVS